MNRYIYLIISMIWLMAASANAQVSAYVEGSVAFTGYNDAKIPGTSAADMFSFVDDLDSPIVPSGRLNIHYKLHPRHQISLLATPLIVKAEGGFDRIIRFQGETFNPGEEITGTYKFNSYRLQYRYLFSNNKILRSLGLSIKVRDAIISLESDNGKYAEKTDLGVVPLISFDLGYDISDKVGLYLGGEALASKFGRAEDVQLAVDYKLNPRYTLRAGYRLLEGGSDIDEVYTFAMFHYPTLGLKVDF